MTANQTEHEFALEADGFTLTWAVTFSPESKESLVGRVSLKLAPELGGETLGSTEVAIMTADFVRLRDYLESHMAALRSGAPIADYPFLGYDLGYQVQALHGELEDGEGEFGLRAMVLKGTSASGQRVYVGAESLMTTVAARRLMESLAALA